MWAGFIRDSSSWFKATPLGASASASKMARPLDGKVMPALGFFPLENRFPHSVVAHFQDQESPEIGSGADCFLRPGAWKLTEHHFQGTPLVRQRTENQFKGRNTDITCGWEQCQRILGSCLKFVTDGWM